LGLGVRWRVHWRVGGGRVRWYSLGWEGGSRVLGCSSWVEVLLRRVVLRRVGRRVDGRSEGRREGRGGKVDRGGGRGAWMREVGRSREVRSLILHRC